MPVGWAALTAPTSARSPRPAPAAVLTGKLTLKPWSIVTEVLYDKDRKRATGVRVLDAVTEQTTDEVAKVIFLCASTLNSTWLLVRSATDIWPGGLKEQFQRVGPQPDGSSLSMRGGRHPGEALDDQYYYGRRPNGIYISPRCYRNLFGDKRDYLRGFGYQGAASRRMDAGRQGIGIGRGIQGRNDFCRAPGNLAATAFGEMLPDHANSIQASTRLRSDKGGLPVLKD